MRPCFPSLARVAGVFLLGLAGQTQAQTSYYQRAFSVDIGYTVVNNQQTSPTARFEDKFNNLDPLTGGQYVNRTNPAPIYSLRNNGFSAGSETSPGDMFNQVAGVGLLRYSLADAIASPSVLDQPGTVAMTNRITLRDPTEGAFMTSAQSFSVDGAFMFATPDMNSYYGIRVSDSTGVGSAFNDLIDLRVTNNSGVASLNLRRLTSAGGLDLVNQGYGTAPIASHLNAGKFLTDIFVVLLELTYVPGPANAPQNGLRASSWFLDAGGSQIGSYDFFDATNGGTYPLIFHGEDFTHASAGATWTVSSVPEPETWGMMLAGLAALGAVARRRQLR